LLSLAGDQITDKGDIIDQRNSNTNAQIMNKSQRKQDLMRFGNLPKPRAEERRSYSIIQSYKGDITFQFTMTTRVTKRSIYSHWGES